MTTSGFGPGGSGEDTRFTPPADDAATTRIEQTADAAGFRDPESAGPPGATVPDFGGAGGLGASGELADQGRSGEPVRTAGSAGLTESAVVAVPVGGEPAPAAGPPVTAGPAEPSTSDDGSTVDQFRDRGRAALAVLGELARQRPAAFLAGAAVAGAVVSRVLGGRREEE